MNFLSINEFIQGSTQTYLDPGSGSMLIQIVLAALLGAGVAIRIFWRNIKAFFTGKKASEGESKDPTGVVDDDPTSLPSDPTSARE
jgi:hypothetical protein